MTVRFAAHSSDFFLLTIMFDSDTKVKVTCLSGNENGFFEEKIEEVYIDISVPILAQCTTILEIIIDSKIGLCRLSSR